jgi:hypothetical protein
MRRRHITVTMGRITEDMHIDIGAGGATGEAHDLKKWELVFGKDQAQETACGLRHYANVSARSIRTIATKLIMYARISAGNLFRGRTRRPASFWNCADRS